MKVFNPRSILWRLLGVLAAAILLTLWLSWSWSATAELTTAYLPAAQREELLADARAAESAWQRGGAPAAQAWLEDFRQREGVWAVLIDRYLQSLTEVALSDADRSRLTFLRSLDSPVRRNRFNTVPDVLLPFPGNTGDGALVLQLPSRFLADSSWPLYRGLAIFLPPLLACLLLGIYIQRHLLRPLRQLREQANNLKGDNLDQRLPATLCARRDELGELAGAFNHMSDRLQGNLEFQRQLLRDLSHELRTPMSRLCVARESATALGDLQQRLDQEMEVMGRLVENTLKLAWLDTEKPQMAGESIALARLWDILVDNACFESGWEARRMPCLLGDDCLVLGNLNGLHHALENLLRNAIRHSPENGRVFLEGERDGDVWHIRVRDEGPGVAEADLQRIFEPFVRLNGARPADGGFGLGLSIAKSALALQGVSLRAENASPGLTLHMRLPTA